MGEPDPNCVALAQDREKVALLLAYLPMFWRWTVGMSLAHYGFSPLLWPTDSSVRLLDMLMPFYGPGGEFARKVKP